MELPDAKFRPRRGFNRSMRRVDRRADPRRPRASSSSPMRSASRAALGLAGVAWASALSASPERTQETIEDNVNDATGSTRKAIDLVIVPIPQSNPSIGSGFEVSEAHIFKHV